MSEFIKVSELNKLLKNIKTKRPTVDILNYNRELDTIPISYLIKTNTLILPEVFVYLIPLIDSNNKKDLIIENIFNLIVKNILSYLKEINSNNDGPEYNRLIMLLSPYLNGNITRNQFIEFIKDSAFFDVFEELKISCFLNNTTIKNLIEVLQIIFEDNDKDKLKNPIDVLYSSFCKLSNIHIAVTKTELKIDNTIYINDSLEFIQLCLESNENRLYKYLDYFNNKLFNIFKN